MCLLHAINIFFSLNPTVSPNRMADITPQPSESALSLYQKVLLPFKVLTLGILFLSGCLSVIYTQFLTNLFVKDESAKKYIIGFTKKNFATLVIFMTTYFSSTSIISLSFKDDDMLKKSVKMNGPNRGKLMLDQSAIIIANHQIYSDWLYLWFIAYLNDCHDHLFIIMKDSLRKIPILGYGMKNYSFVFLSRKWETDYQHMKTQFNKICNLSNKVWMLIFPEGTNINNAHLIKSLDYAKKVDGPRMNTVLLPRVKGLYLGLKELAPNTTKIIDFTIAYSGHKLEEQAQDIYTLFKVYIEGQSPKKISILINEYEMKDEVPSIDLTSFKTPSKEQEEEEMEVLTKWIYKKWEEKDKDMNYYYTNGNYGRSTIDVPLKLVSPFELLLVYIIPINSFIVMYFAFKLYQFILGAVL